MPSPTRFLDDGKYLGAYADKVHVKCIRCATPGTIVAERIRWRWRAAFECGECGLQLNSSRNDWVGPVRLTGRRPCGYCGYKWLTPQVHQSGWPREVVRSTPAACPQCGHESDVALQAHRVYEGAGAHDPHFGMPLLLVDAGRFGALWAYNEAHLDALNAYVAATLRERTVHAGNASMFSRLPAWIKSAKNRVTVSKRLAKLKRLLPRFTVKQAT